MMVDERHFFVAFDEIVLVKWKEGLAILMSSERTKELYFSLYPSE